MVEEGFVLQGMTMDDCRKCKDVGISKSQLWKQVGNGLTRNVVSLIFEHIYKAFYDSSYECLDEKMVKEGYGIADESDGNKQMTIWDFMEGGA